MADIALRLYQQEFIDNIRNEFKQNHKRVVGVAPCGVGKTIITGWMIREALQRGKKSVFFVHRNELIQQTALTFSRLDIPHGIIAAGVEMKLDLPVQIASVQTLAKRLYNKDGSPNSKFINALAPDFLICDECHHILANTYKKIIDTWQDAYLLGVTATPQRMGGINLGDVFTSMVQSVSVAELIKLGNLTNFNYFAPASNIDLSKVRSKFGEFVNSDLEHVMNDKKIIGNIIDNYRNFADGKSAICYCVNVNHSISVSNRFIDAGIPAAHVDGETPTLVRNNLVDEFRRGNIKVLCNAELFSEGFDVPKCQAVILARPTKSLTLFIQQAMRPLRPDPDDPNKVAVIIDHVQNCRRFGLPDFNHEWSLEPNKKKKTGDAPVKTCPNCSAVVPISAAFCPICNFDFELPERDTHEYDGDLIHIQRKLPQAPPSPRISHKPTSIEDFIAIANRKKYQPAWAAFKALEFANSYDDCLHIAQVCGYKTGWAWHKWQEISL